MDGTLCNLRLIKLLDQSFELHKRYNTSKTRAKALHTVLSIF